MLITGATGLVGQYLLKDLFDHGQRLAVIARPGKRMTSLERIEAIMHRWEAETDRRWPRPVILEGDISCPQLKLSPEQQAWVHAHCDRIIHSAATLQFHGPSRQSEPWATNVQGTRNVLQFAATAEIPEFHYVSTAYVSGRSEKVIYEDDFDRNQTFRNDYERSKFESEKLVRESDQFESKTIYRPAVIVGDSQTGYTSSYHGLFTYLRFMATHVPAEEIGANGKRHTPIHLPIEGNEPRNLVPVDWVSRVICRILCNPEAHNRTFHLVPDQLSTARQIIDSCCEYFNSTGVVYGSPLDEVASQSQFAVKFFENLRVYDDYFKSDPVFDATNLKAFCEDLVCPEIDGQTIHRFLDFGISGNWGKRKTNPPRVEPWITNTRNVIQAAVERLDNELGCLQATCFGVDVFGPGGGQWQIHIHPPAEVSCRSGLPAGGDLILEFGHDNMELGSTGKTKSSPPPVIADSTSSWMQFLRPRLRPERASSRPFQLNT